MGRRRRAATVVICITTLAVAGCGSSGPSRSQFIARADAICHSSLAQLRAREATASTLATVVPVIASEVRQLSALKQPTQDRALLRRYLAAMHTWLAGWRQLESVMAQGARNAQALSVAQATVSSNVPATLARRYGLMECSTAGASAGSGSAA